MSDPGHPKPDRVVLRDVHKIFGPRAEDHVAAVRAGIDKETLLREHDHVLALRDIDLAVPERCFQMVMGLSGCGKSTLLRHVNRLITPTAGTVSIDGTDLATLSRPALRDLRRRRIGMVFQGFALFPHKTVAENIGYGLATRGVGRASWMEAARDWVARVGLDGYADRYPDTLSGGMRQRVGLARALATEADILLLDEPFSALDPLIRVEMRELLAGLQRDLRKTILFITHDLEEALTLGDRVAVMDAGQILQNGKPSEILLRPADRHVERFTRDVNRGRVLRVGAVAIPGTPGTPETMDEKTRAPLDADLSLEAALPLIADRPELAHGVARTDGAIIGRITLAEMLRAMRPAAAPVTSSS